MPDDHITHVHGEEFSSKWSQNIWDMLKDEGVWGVPRSGLMYRKEAGRMRLVLYARLPYDERMPWSREELIEFQNDDHGAISEVFATIGVEVVDETHSRKVGGTTEAGT